PIGNEVLITSTGEYSASNSDTTVDIRWCTCLKVYAPHNSSTLTDPFFAVRDKSLRTRSTIIIFSERSFSFFVSSSLIASSSSVLLLLLAVPFMGWDIILFSSFLIYLSGDAESRYCLWFLK